MPRLRREWSRQLPRFSELSYQQVLITNQRRVAQIEMYLRNILRESFIQQSMEDMTHDGKKRIAEGAVQLQSRAGQARPALESTSRGAGAHRLHLCSTRSQGLLLAATNIISALCVVVGVFQVISLFDTDSSSHSFNVRQPIRTGDRFNHLLNRLLEHEGSLARSFLFQPCGFWSNEVDL